MNDRPVFLTASASILIVLQSAAALAHEPIFGLGPHTIYQYGYAAGFEFEKGEQGWANHLEMLYGLTPDWAVTVVAPYLFEDRGRPAGFGDMVLRTKYRFYRADRRGASSQAALHAGIKFPTGNPDKQLGGGVTDFFIGASFGYESRRHYFFAGARYYINRTYQGLNRADVAAFNLAYGIRPWKLEYEQPDPVIIWELNGESAGASRRDNHEFVASGGTTLRIGPGLLLSLRNVMLKLGASLPFLERHSNPDEGASAEYVVAVELHLPPLR